MSTTHLPPLPPSEAHNSNTCATVKLYLAVWNDLTPAQRDMASAHIAICERCTREQRLMNRVTFLLSTLEDSQPSQRVDMAVMAAIAAHSQKQPGGARHSTIGIRTINRNQNGWNPGNNTFRYVSIFVTAAVVLLAVFSTTRFMKQASGVFLLPSTLSWSAYILYHTQKETDRQGQVYRVESYHDLGSQRVHVETTQGNNLDVVYVGSMDATMPSLAVDEIHHVAQWNASSWDIDSSTEEMFDLSELRHELQNQSAIFANEDNFHGQTVYRIRCKNGLVLLLDTHYHPVNVLAGAVGTGTGEPIFDKLQFLPKQSFDSSMWNMQVPAGFSMGALPAKP